MIKPLLLCVMTILTTATNASPVRRAPIEESICETSTLVDAEFRDAALAAFDRLVIRSDGQTSDGAIQSHHAAGHLDPQGHAWHQVTAYAANLAMLGVMSVSKQSLPVAANWLRWQARHIEVRGRFGGVVLDHWIRADGTQESLCPPGMAKSLCSHVDAFDSTAASTLLMADGYMRFGGDANLLREPPIRIALESAALSLVQLSNSSGLTLAKPDYPVVYTMDAVEVMAGWRAWARIQRDVYAQPASAINSLHQAKKIEAAALALLWDKRASNWRVSLDSGPVQPSRWYPDTVAQSWPLLWGLKSVSPSRSKATWRKAIAPWQEISAGKTREPPSDHWAHQNVDEDGFWWPAVSVAAQCVGDPASAKAWVARARKSWMKPEAPFDWPFQVSDLLWLLWMAEPIETHMAPAKSRPSSEFNVDQQLQGIAP